MEAALNVLTTGEELCPLSGKRSTSVGNINNIYKETQVEPWNILQ